MTEKKSGFCIIKEANSEDFSIYPPTQYDEVYMDQYMQRMWNDLENIAFDEMVTTDLILAEDWWGFKKGTERESIWHFFDHWYSKGVVHLLYPYKNEKQEES